jgi:hypothetical protein
MKRARGGRGFAPFSQEEAVEQEKVGELQANLERGSK